MAVFSDQLVITARKRVLGKMMFSQASVILSRCGDWLPNMHQRSQGSASEGSRGGGLHPRGREVCLWGREGGGLCPVGGGGGGEGVCIGVSVYRGSASRGRDLHLERSWADPLPHTMGYGQQAGGKNPTRMFSCLDMKWYIYV